MTDNTQELDGILEDAIYDNIPELNAIYGQMAIDEAKQAILDWHNKQIDELLDRLWQHSEVMNSDVVPAYGVPLSAIEGERNKLKEVK